MAAAAKVSTLLPRSPTAAPIPMTTATYTSVKNTTSAPATTVFLTTMSRSYRRYRRMAMAEAAGIPRKIDTNSSENRTLLTREFSLRMPETIAPTNSTASDRPT